MGEGGDSLFLFGINCSMIFKYNTSLVAGMKSNFRANCKVIQKMSSPSEVRRG